MYIEQIRLIDWKTFRGQTVLSDLIYGCTTIVGKNGSGKSNIIDAIMFVFNDSSHKNLRINRSFNELISTIPDRQGNLATKARVDVKLRIEDPRSFGLDIKKNRITLSRLIQNSNTKLLIDNKQIKSKDFDKLIKQLKFSTTNPLFLVRQGQVAKVTEQNPEDFLFMIEECLGTKYYTVEKEEFEEIERLKKLHDPVVEKFQSEYKIYKKKAETYEKIHQEAKKGVELIAEEQKKVIPYKYLQLQVKYQELSLVLTEKQDKIKVKKDLITEFQKEVVEKQQEIEKIEANHKIQGEKKQEINSADQKLTELKGEIEEKEAKLDQIKKDKNEARIKIKDIEIQIQQVRKKQQSLKQNVDELQQNLSNQENRLKNMSDLKSEDFQVNIVKELQKDIQRMESDTTTLIKTEKQKKDALTASIAQQQTIEKSIESNKIRIEELKQEIKNLEDNLPKPPPTPEKPNSPQLNEQIKQSHQQKLRKLDPNHYIRPLPYKNPTNNWNRDDLYGRTLVCFEVGEEKYEKGLEIGASGKLFDYLVKDSACASILINKKCFDVKLCLRYIPIENVISKPVSDEMRLELKRIETKFKGEARIPLDLISYDPKFKKAMNYVFGDFILTSTVEIAKYIVTNKNTQFRMKCVTLDGEVLSPSGTAEGGELLEKVYYIPRVKEYKSLQRELQERMEQNRGREERYNKYLKELQEHNEYISNLQNKRQELGKIQSDLKDNKNQFKKEEYEQELTDIRVKIQENQRTLEENRQKLKSFKEGKRNAEQELQSLKQTIKVLQKKVQNERSKKNEILKRIQKLESQIEECNQVINNTNTTPQEQRIQELKKQCDELVETISTLKHQFQELASESAAHRLKQAKQRLTQIPVQIQNIKIQIQKLEMNNEDTLNRKKFDAVKQEIKAIQKNYKWVQSYIVQEKLQFSQYPPNYLTPQQRQRHPSTTNIRTIAQDIVEHTRKVAENNSIPEIQAFEKQRALLRRDQQILKKHHQKLEQCRIQALEIAYNAVRTNFKNIISYLLKSFEGDLVYADPKGKDITKGLKIVMKKKNNTTAMERGVLSGGEKALLSIGFICSLLLCSPCPLYLFDEIDAALDGENAKVLSLMIVLFFPKSQFLVISHREHFKNLSKLYFEIEFRETGSVLRRITNNPTEGGNNGGKEKGADKFKGKEKKKEGEEKEQDKKEEQEDMLDDLKNILQRR